MANAVDWFYIPTRHTEEGGFMSNETKLVLLGTGTPIPDPERSGPSVAVITGACAYIVDLGPGVVRRAEAVFKRGIPGLEVPRLKIAFLTHLHSDHTIGVPDFILTPWVVGREEKISIFGPRGTKRLVKHIQRAYRDDKKERMQGLERVKRTGCMVHTREISPGVVYEDSNVLVEAFLVVHGRWQAFGYKFTTHDRSIVISGDTAMSEVLVEKSLRCDILVHEVYSREGLEARDPQWQRYHKTMHTSSYELGIIAETVQPGLLVLYHQLFWGVTEKKLLDEVQRHYSGRVDSGRDLNIY
jgi:ribonuclease BN (tRNA processing enzyme)